MSVSTSNAIRRSMFVSVRTRVFRLFAACLQSGDLIVSQMTDFIGAPKGIKIRTLISLKLNVFRFQASIYGKHIALNE